MDITDTSKSIVSKLLLLMYTHNNKNSSEFWTKERKKEVVNERMNEKREVKEWMIARNYFEFSLYWW